jgi:hypothetical protein
MPLPGRAMRDSWGFYIGGLFEAGCGVRRAPEARFLSAAPGRYRFVATAIISS